MREQRRQTQLVICLYNAGTGALIMKEQRYHAYSCEQNTTTTITSSKKCYYITSNP